MMMMMLMMMIIMMIMIVWFITATGSCYFMLFHVISASLIMNTLVIFAGKISVAAQRRVSVVGPTAGNEAARDPHSEVPVVVML